MARVSTRKSTTGFRTGGLYCVFSVNDSVLRKNQGRLRLGKWGTPTLTEEIKDYLKHTFLPLLPDFYPLLSFPSSPLPSSSLFFLHHSLHPCLSPPGVTLPSDSTPSLLALLPNCPSEQTSYVSNPFTAIPLWRLRWTRLYSRLF